MIPCGILIEDLFDILNADNDERMQGRIWRRLNYEYFELCSEVSWASLRCGVPANLDFSGADSTGLWLPSDLIGIDLVIDRDEKLEFHEKDQPAAMLDEYGYRYYRYFPSRSDLASGSDVVVAKGGSSFTSASLTAAGTAVNGEFVMFGDEMGMYEITSDVSPFTFVPTYHGPAKTNKSYVIRPWSRTQKMVIIGPDEANLYDRDVDVYYWKAPVPLYRSEDMILLPSAEILKLRVLRSIPEAKSRFPVSDTMLQTALNRAARQNPAFSRSTDPLDKHYARYAGTACPFGTR